MERLRNGPIEKIITRPPLKMSPEKVLRRAEEIYEMAVEQNRNGKPVYMQLLRKHTARYRYVDLYLMDRGKGLSREEMSERLGRFWVDKLK